MLILSKEEQLCPEWYQHMDSSSLFLNLRRKSPSCLNCSKTVWFLFLTYPTFNFGATGPHTNSLKRVRYLGSMHLLLFALQSKQASRYSHKNASIITKHMNKTFFASPVMLLLSIRTVAMEQNH